MLRHDLEKIYQIEISFEIRTDSLQMFDFITKASSTTEQRLRICIVAAHESYNREEISHVGLVTPERYIADGLTKENPNEVLQYLLHFGFDRSSVQQFIVRTPASSSLKTRECRN